MRLELTTFRSLLVLFHYETDALPTALPRQVMRVDGNLEKSNYPSKIFLKMVFFCLA